MKFLGTRKTLLCLAISVFASLFFSQAASALQLVELTPNYAANSAIELNTPADGYDFDATLLDQNLTLQYQATVTNDESDDIVITSIGLTDSSQPFISYSYDGISAGDIMAAGTSRQITIYIKTNDQPTRTIDEDFDLTLNYRKSNQPVNPSGDETNPTPDPEQNPETPSAPNTFDNIAVVALLFTAVVAIAIIVIRKNGRIRHLVVIFALPLLALLFPAQSTNAVDSNNFSIRGQVHFINSYTLTINPNGGEYAGDLETVHREGSEITIQDPTRATYKFDGWTAEGSPIENGKITITEDTTLTANWSEIYYSLTINPNGGEYNHSTSTNTDMVRAGERVSLLTPTKTGATFRDWTKNGTTFTGDNFIIEENTTLIANYDDIFFNISVNPNGGLFHDRDDLYTDRIKYGNPLDLTSITPISHYELYSWTRNGSETLSADTDSINIFEDTNLVANWRSTRFFDVTINPNGGEYKGTTENDIKPVREFEEYTIDGDNPLREGYLYLGWILEDGSDLPSTTFTVYRPIEIRANWMFIAARNERTQTLYPSITAAAEEAQNGDTITVLADFEEKAHINKNITLDLNGHTISGYLINDGNVTLLNGEINSSETAPDTDNPNGAAIINYGTLTLGIDDYKDNENHVKSALVDNNYVRIIGTTVGLQQNGSLNYYDGYIEGDVALSGGYNDSPWYRDTFDGIVVRHFPFVDHNNVRNCQHVILENSDNAVSKTVDNGEIYYYNLQDNINTSIRTGYKIYAVRDFDAGYTVTIPENTDIIFDVTSYNVTLNDTITIDGKFTIEDSATRISTAENTENVTAPALNAPTFITPHNDTITTATYAGSVSVPQTIINNGELVIKNAFVTGTTGNDTIRNLGTLSMEGGIIGATTGYVTQLAENSIYNLDDNSYIYSTSESKAAVYNELNDYTWSSGNITGRAIGFHNKGANVTISDVTIIADNPSATSLTVRGVYQNNNNSAITLSNANVIVKSVTTTSASCDNGGSHCTYGVSGPVNLQNHSSVTVTTTSNSPAYGISGASNITDSAITINAHGTGAGVNGTAEITRSDITVTSEGSSAYGAYSNNVTLNSGNIAVETTNNGVAGGIYVTSGTSNARHTIKDGTVTVKTQKGKAYGIYGSCSSNYGAYALTTMTGGTFDVHSEQGIAYGVYGNYCSASYHSRIDMSGGSITANSDTNESYGINASGNTITGGKVEGGKYGIYSTNTTPTTLGNLESAGLNIENPEIIGAEYALYGGSANFYDGVLRGQTAYQEGVIKAIPDGATLHNESSADYDDNCWLVNSDPYLFAGGQPWSSLADAYAAITPEDPTIKVIDDAVIEAVLPASPDDATVIFDLNGHSLTYTQPLINNGTMTIVDDSPQKTGIFKNTNPNASAIQNNGTLTVNGITIEAAETAINNANTLTVTDTTITTPHIGIYSKGVSGARASMTIDSVDITSEYMGIYNYQYSTAIVSDSTVTVNNTATAKTVYGINNYSSTSNPAMVISNTSVSVTSATTTSYSCDSSSSHCTYGVYGSATISDSDITVTTTSSSPAYGTSGTTTLTDSDITVNAYGPGYGASGNTTVTSSNITVTSENSSAYAINSSNATVNSGTISATAKKNSSARGINSSSNSSEFHINGGTITAQTANGSAYGIYGGCSQSYTCMDATMTGGSVIAQSDTGIAYGLYGAAYSASKQSNITMSGGTITASSNSNDSYGINASGNTITGGKVQGGKYGIYGNSAAPTTLGNISNAIDIEHPEIIGGEYALYDGSVYFYDGVLRGQTAAQDDVIKATPDGTSLHHESSADYDDNCWLVNSDPYLFAGGQPWSSLADAYAAITPEDPTIKVIDDAVIEATLPASPTDATVIFDLNGHTITYTQSLINNGNMTIVDDSPQKTGLFKNINPNVPAIVNNAELTVDTVKIEAAETAINNTNTLSINDTTITTPHIGIYSKGTSKTAFATVALDNTTINSEYSALYNYQYSTATITDSTLSVNNTATGKTVYGIYSYNNSTYATVTLSNSTVTVDSATTTSYSCDSSSSHCTYGVYGVSTIDQNSTVTVTTTSASPAYGVSGTSTIENATITTNAYGAGYGVSGNTEITSSDVTVTSESSTAYAINSSSATLNSGTISATAKNNNSARGINSSSNSSEFHINGGTITAQAANGTAYGIYGGCSQSYSCMKASMSAGAITASSVSGIAYGVYGTPYSASKSSRITLTGGTITANSDANESYGINASGNTLLGGIVKGGTYGLYGNGAAATTIGDNDGAIDIEHPEIIGGTYALNGGSVNFYDGVLKGGNKANQEGVIKTIAANAAIYTENQIIDGANYEVRYLTSEGFVAEINGTGYLALSSAVEHAQPNDIIDLVAENYLFAPLEIDSEKKFTIRTNGYGIHTGHPIINDGDVQLINNSSTQTLIEYTQSSYFIQNHADAHFHLQNFQIDATDAIDNAGSFTMESVSLNASDIAIHNTGELHAQTNMVITGSTYPIYNDSGDNEASISDVTLTGSEIYNASGTLTLRNSTTSKTSTSSSVKKFITNEGTMNLDSFTAAFNINPSSNGSNTDYTETIYNLGTLNISGNSNIQTIAASESYSFVNHISSIYNNGGTVTIDGATITTQTTDLRSYSRTTYGIYNPSGNVTVKDATIESIGKGAAYGIWNTSGIVTLGEAEPVTSINYGGEHADVSITSPLLKASTTSTSSNKTAIAIKNDTGKIYYYDGKVMGQTAAMPDNPAGVEYLYEPKDFVEDGYQCRILEWMREQPGNQP